MPGRNVIETADLRKVFGEDNDTRVAALDGVSLTVRESEFIAIMGPSGSGKSTLLYILGCLSTPTSGRYKLDGEDISGLNRRELAGIRNRKLGFVFQSYNLLPRTDALRNVMLPLQYDHVRLLDNGASEGKARQMLERVGLGSRIHHQPHQLSGGQQQRVAIARALVNDPVVIIADEPTGNLDTHSGDEVMRLLKSLHAQGVTIVMVTHNPAIAANASREIHLLDGRIDNIIANGIHTAGESS